MSPNRDKCGRCEASHGGNDHSCPVHGAVSEGCCNPLCDKESWIVIQEVFPSGQTKSLNKVLVETVDLAQYTQDGLAFDLPLYKKDTSLKVHMPINQKLAD